MFGFSEATWLWLAKAAGAVVGSAISLAYLLPSGRRDAAIRFAVGVACGVVFGGTAGRKIAIELGIAGHLAPGELVLMGSAAASLCAWSAIGFIMRFLGAGGTNEPRHETKD
ncbi:DUF6107 family protein [Chelativorans sp. Marseille-P2723]|uniref:DUF6107 family protein n=1 Tax=Chelativorans sp. Marseille-P2723 TaxID=2709133 RepID=UPI00156EB18A|nr:DUF6107 family protein [Chelativorans sp. Marseille-P2723]